MWAAKEDVFLLNHMIFLLKMNVWPAFERGTCNKNFSLPNIC